MLHLVSLKWTRESWLKAICQGAGPAGKRTWGGAGSAPHLLCFPGLRRRQTSCNEAAWCSEVREEETVK